MEGNALVGAKFARSPAPLTAETTCTSPLNTGS
jgi:hypothetical protein